MVSFIPMLLIIEFDEMPVGLQHFDRLPSSVLEWEVFPFGEVEYFSTENSAPDYGFNLVWSVHQNG